MTQNITRNWLYIDDERTPKAKLHPPGNCVIVRTYIEAVNYIKENGVPFYISFDHDLGSDGTGYDIAKWLIEADLDGEVNIPFDFQFNVHSANPQGKKNIESILNNYLHHKLSDKFV